MISINSEIELANRVTWGSHFCYFYDNKYELINLLVPYFQVGLENNEFCLWIASEDISPEFAKSALREAIIDFDDYLKKGQIKILPYTKWYIKDDEFNLEQVIQNGTNYLNYAITNGYSGLRGTGDARWINKKDLERFIDFEIQITNTIGEYNIKTICTYPISRFSKFELLEIANSHQFVLTKEDGKYKVIENVDWKRIKKEKKKILSNIQNIENLLDSIQVNAELALKKIKNDNPAYKFLKEIYASAESISRLIRKS